MADRLFVYGTLRRGSTHPLARRLATEAKYLGQGKVKGRLYDFGPYPGAMLDETSRDSIEGDLYEIGENSGLLAALDAYEGCDDKADDEYCRVLVPVMRRGDEPVEALTYALAKEDRRLPRVQGGKWRGPAARKAASR